MKHKLFRLILALLLPVMAGCSGMDTVRLGQDRPEDLDRLLEQHEYARARQLTSKHPSLDTLEVQIEVNEKVFTDEIKGLEKLERSVEKEIKEMLGVSAKVRLVESKTIERFEGKAKRVIDNRKI